MRNINTAVDIKEEISTKISKANNHIAKIEKKATDIATKCANFLHEIIDNFTKIDKCISVSGSIKIIGKKSIRKRRATKKVYMLLILLETKVK